MSDSVEVDIRLTVQDLFLVRLLQLVRKPLIIAGIAAVMLLLLGIFVYSIAAYRDPNYLALAEFCLIGFSVPMMLFISTKRYFKSAPHVQEPMQYTITSTDVTVISPTYASRLVLARAWKIQETSEYFLLWESKLAAHVLPKRSFRNSEEVAAVRALVHLSRPNVAVQAPVV